ncbi:MAG: bifunctional demethylmenaquinone methyltransferase/2-methoxy-6-polyprenyl-1,4-benzoquinol methylase UbiE [Candidatus Azobacteroides sp.]|nr:bifunctional demethylmenaquinone methyltransferase/2-methoxy-6-polyprenyl-1,4-benzoquinol methylase UbiE [Candidatus Azobacteroides sp.]
MNKAEKIVPYATSDNKTVQIERMFDEIAGKYDTLNHTLSAGIDKRWRKKGILTLKELQPEIILDIATGTGDLAIQAYHLLHPEKIIGIDISQKMMDVGEEKVKTAGLSDRIIFQKEDSLHMSFEDNSFDAAMVAFGVRNFENLNKGLREILRVLKPGGKLMILELTTPEKFPMKQLYKIYSKVIIPTIGKLISGNQTAYSYLPQSIAAFPQGKTMQSLLLQNGFKDAWYKRFTFGICTMYVGTKS